MDLYLIFEFLYYLDLFSRPTLICKASDHFQTKMKKVVFGAHVHQNTQNYDLSRQI